uniref:Uncharacterized protein n=1 Tax=Kalanchoe fedtschenkoi TaxID=63787 RepID=A0A7N1A7B8_KALFE
MLLLSFLGCLRFCITLTLYALVVLDFVCLKIYDDILKACFSNIRSGRLKLSPFAGLES